MPGGGFRRGRLRVGGGGGAGRLRKTGGNGQQVTSREATQLLMDIYPERVRSWIERRGGLSPRMMYLSGRELTAMYQTCD